MTKYVVIAAFVLFYAALASAHPHDAVARVSCPPYGGSGTLVGVSKNGRGLLLTAAHVIEEGDRSRISCTFPKINKTFRARILGEDRRYDIAALDIAAPEGIETPLIAAPRKENGPFYSVGYPWNAQGGLRWSKGPMIGFAGGGESAWLPSMLHTRATVISGYSGGCTLDRYGRMVAIVSGMTGDGPNLDRTWGVSGPALEKFAARWLKQK